MHLWTDLGQVPPGEPSVVTIGNFDGVHRGHSKVLAKVVALAKERNARAVAVTFFPHPAQVHRPESAPPLITTLDDRLDLISDTGIDGALVVEYTEDFASQSPEEFVSRYLVSGLSACAVVVGHDVRFGRKNAGTMDTMIELGKEFGFEVMAIDDVEPADDAKTPAQGVTGRRISSSSVRAHLHAGEVRDAAAILGRDHHVRGVVVHGEARGRTLGFPTANLSNIGGIVPADGVYAGWLNRPELAATAAGHADIRLPAAISIGTNPTFDGLQRQVEAYVLDRTDLDLYDEQVVLEFVEFLRPTLRFDGIDPLVSQMRQDVDKARDILAAPPRTSGGGRRKGTPKE